jgi:hypothetical protein
MSRDTGLILADEGYCGNYGVVGLTNKNIHKGQIRGSLVHRCVAWVLKASYTEEKHGHAGQENASNTKETEPEMGNQGGSTV